MRRFPFSELLVHSKGLNIPRKTPLPASADVPSPRAPHDAAPSPRPFSIVGIGASAGGIEALKEFFEAMPAETGAAFVVIQHLSPTHDSHMVDILAKSTVMPVREARHGMRVEPNTVYTNPPGRALGVDGGTFVVGSAKRGRVETAIDHFLISLAETCGPLAVGIILSGSTGHDGPRGVRAVREAGGVCLAQDPGSAQYPMMPQAAIDTGLVDYVLKPSQMPAQLTALALQTRRLEDRRESPHGLGLLENILHLLHTHTRYDYTHYKRPTVLRRIQRRMAIRQVNTLPDYYTLLKGDPQEMDQLAKDMLIGVSSFFRDPDVFAALNAKVILPLVRSRAAEEPIRAWVAGCSTGEEAYTVAMLLLDALAAVPKACPVKIFATDIDAEALETARAGIYGPGIVADIPAPLLETYFTKQLHAYQVNKKLREALVFSRHNVLVDPPFLKLDLISCRNVLIYLNAEAQNKVLSTFRFALAPGGHLLLGKSEGVGGTDLFEPLYRKGPLFLVKRAFQGVPPGFPPAAVPAPVSDRGPERPALAPVMPLGQASLEALLRHFDASAVLIDSDSTILHFHGRTEKYLGHPKGAARFNILNMTDGTLSTKLRRAINQALKQDEPVRLTKVALPQAQAPWANITVMRLEERLRGNALLAVIFEDAQPAPPAAPSPASAKEEPLVVQLEAEIKALTADLRANTEGYEAALEELKATNEELMSANEELQSANEELESSKEELQSLNEELATVNNQLSEKVGELTETNDDLNNVMSATEIAMIFLDSQLRIRRFTPRAKDIFNLIDSDAGRPLSHITHGLDVDLSADMAQVLKSLSPLEKEMQTRDGRWFTVRMLPYRTVDDRIAGLVVTFTNVSRLKEIESHLRSERNYAELIIETMRQPLLILDSDLQVLTANRAFTQTFQLGGDPVAGRKLYELGNLQWNIPQLRVLLEEVIPKSSSFDDFRVEHEFPRIGHKVMLMSGRRIEALDKRPSRILLTIQDVTHHEASEAHLRDLTDRLTRSNTELEQFAYLVSHDLQEPLRMITGFLDLLGPRLNERLDEAQREHMGYVLQGAQRMQALIRDLLDLSRLGKTSTKRMRIDLATPLTMALESLRSKIDQNKAIITHDLLPTVMADPSQLSRLFQNLIGNAIKFRRDEPPVIHISAAPREGMWMITVRDNGIGIDMQFADRLFKVFQRLHTQEAYEGTGIGLAICKKIVEHHGGLIWLESEPGKGSAFHFTLPADGIVPAS